jgi:hypothetical protein
MTDPDVLIVVDDGDAGPSVPVPFGGSVRVPWSTTDTTVIAQSGTALSLVNDSNSERTIFQLGDGPNDYWLITMSLTFSFGGGGGGQQQQHYVSAHLVDASASFPSVPLTGRIARGQTELLPVDAHGNITLAGVVKGSDISQVSLYIYSNTSGVTIRDRWASISRVSSVPESTAGEVVGRNVRTSDSPTFTGTAVRILSTRAPVMNGRSYAIVVDGEVEMTSAGAATTQHELRITTNDVEPTTSDTQLARIVTFQDPSGVPVGVHDEAYFHASADGFLRVAVCSHRPVGSNAGQWTASSDRPMTLSIIDVGPTVATTGTVYT